MRLPRKGGPWKEAPYDKKVEGGAWIIPDKAAGFRYAPGVFRISSGDGPVIRYTNNADGRRISRAPGAPRPQGKAIWFLGCSYTYGWGVQDNEHYPRLIQQALPDREIVNFGVNGYGPVHSLMQLERALAKGPAPALVVLGHGVFHDKRNVCSRRYRKRTRSHHQVVYLVPYAVPGDGDFDVEVRHRPLTYEPWPGQTGLALVHMVERISNRIGEWAAKPDQVAKGLLLRIAATCRKRDIPFVVAGIDNRHLEDRLDWCREQGIAAVDISVDLTDPDLRNPYDGHPSARAHTIFAERLLAFLRENKLLE